MRILFLSFYFKPDLSAGSFRSESLINALVEILPYNGKIEIITTQPNRYSSFTNEAPHIEERSNIIIRRIKLSHHKSGMLDQARAYLDFARQALKILENKDFDLVYATSSRLMTATLGAYISRKIGAPLYIDIRDIFVDTIKDVLPRPFSYIVKIFFSAVEKWTFCRAQRVNLVSPGFVEYFRERYPRKGYDLFTNGIDKEFIAARPHNHTKNHSEVLSVVYAGNFGESQGLHSIIPRLAVMLRGKVVFKLIGDGGRREQLIYAIKSAGCDNVEVLPPIKRVELIKCYREADILFLHLNDYDAFRKVLPSKLFEYAALGKPIWAGIAGHAADFVNENVSNASVFNPCDVNDAIKAFVRLEQVTRPRNEFIQKFSRENIMNEMAKSVINVAQIK